MEKIKVIIADDSDFVRDGMKIILEVDEDFEVLGCAANGREAVRLAEEKHPDVILMDIQMPEMDGIEATKLIVEKNLGKVLILTTFDDDVLVQKALQNGAKGYLIKNHTPEHLKQSRALETDSMRLGIRRGSWRSSAPLQTGFPIRRLRQGSTFPREP